MFNRRCTKGYLAASLHRSANVDTPQGSSTYQTASTYSGSIISDIPSRRTDCRAVAQRQGGRLAGCEGFPLIHDTGKVQTVLLGRTLMTYDERRQL